MLDERANMRQNVFGARWRARRSPVTYAVTMLAAVTIGPTARAQSPALIAGTVIDSAYGRPIDSVRVALVPGRLVKFTDAKGEFRFAEVPPGQYVLQFRKFGYEGVNVRMPIAPGDTLERRFILGRSNIRLESVSIVDPVVITARTSGIPSFDENRRIGLGHFFSRVDLEKQGERTMADVLAGVPGLGIVNGRSGQGYVYSKRMTGSMCPPVRIIPNSEPQSGCLAGQGIYVPTSGEATHGIQIALRRGRPMDPAESAARLKRRP